MCARKEGFQGKSGRVGHKKRRKYQEPWKKMKLIEREGERERREEELRDEREKSRRGEKKRKGDGRRRLRF